MKHKGTHKDQERQSDHVSQRAGSWSWGTVIEFLTLIVLCVYAGFTCQSVRILREQVHVGQRAYLIVEKIKLTKPPEVGSGVRASFDIRNTGQTPALRMSLVYGIDIFLGEPPHVDSIPQHQTRQSSDIGAGRAQPMVVELLNPLTPGDVADLSKEMYGLHGREFTISLRDRRLFVYGLVKYTDVFGGNDETEFCFVYLPKSMQTADDKTFAECTSPARNRIK